MKQLQLIQYALSTLGHVCIKHRWLDWCERVWMSGVWKSARVIHSRSARYEVFPKTPLLISNESLILQSFLSNQTNGCVCMSSRMCIAHVRSFVLVYVCAFSMQAVELDSFCSFVISLLELLLLFLILLFFFVFFFTLFYSRWQCLYLQMYLCACSNFLIQFLNFHVSRINFFLSFSLAMCLGFFCELLDVFHKV